MAQRLDGIKSGKKAAKWVLGASYLFSTSTGDAAQRLSGANGGWIAADVCDLAGEKGSGRSTLLLQTASYALESGWIVLYVPHGE
jgi:predicted ATP-dependent serine protease